MIEKILLDDFSKTKLNIYGKLLTLPKGEYPIKYLQNYLEIHLNPSRIANLLFSIQEDLKKINHFEFKIKKNRIYINPQHMYYSNYQRMLLSESIPYKLLISILTEKDASLSSFCDKNYISRSTCYRQTNKLSEYLKKHQIHLNLSKLSLAGSELVIRIIFFNFFWFVSLGKTLSTISFSREIEEFMNKRTLESSKKGNTEQKQTLLFSLISLQRIKNGYTTDIYAYSTQMFSFSDECFVFFNELFLKLNVKSDILEINTLIYLIYYWPLLNSNNDKRLPTVQKFYRHSKNELDSIFDNFIVHCQTFIGNYEFDKNHPLYFNIYLSIYNFSLFKRNIPLSTHFIDSFLKEKYPHLHILTNKIESYWKKISIRKGYSWLKSLTKELAQFQAGLLSPYYSHMENTYKLKVGYINVSEQIIVSEILNFGSRITFVDIDLLTHPICDTYDYFIFDSPLLIPNDLDPSKYTVIDLYPNNDFETEFYQKLLYIYQTNIEKMATISS